MNTSTATKERQLTSSLKNHELDNNDNFSADLKFLCYDTREVFGPGIDRSRSIEMVEIATGKETVLYAPPFSTSDQAAPGIAAASFSPVANKVAFIHGPPLETLAKRGPYAKTNRNGAEVAGDGSGKLTWLDERDVETGRDTTPGAHRGGTHRHEYSRDGKRIGFTYDDALLPQYDRTIGYMEKNPRAPGQATHYFALLVSVVPKGTSKPGEIESALGDSWVDREGTMRAFIGKVRQPDGFAYEQSLFVVDVPVDVDITTADSGSATRFPRPPKGVRVRRLTHSFAAGIVRGSYDGKRIAYFGHDKNGVSQIFIISSHGSDQDADPKMRPVQATFFPRGTTNGVRWHASGNYVASISDGAVAVTCVKPGKQFGKSIFLTPQDDGPQRKDLVWSPDGKWLAYDRPTPTFDDKGQLLKTYSGLDFSQIFLIETSDLNRLFK
ncbi:MAG: DUF3748 domain-containing protein [Verrucomicrobia bacterium]|nr:DUF3748 domain-containing protein [Verrucomicrobiota bacterium]